jgi:hypothetical protein
VTWSTAAFVGNKTRLNSHDRGRGARCNMVQAKLNRSDHGFSIIAFAQSSPVTAELAYMNDSRKCGEYIEI